MATTGKTFFEGDDTRCFSTVSVGGGGGSGNTLDTMESYANLAAVNGLNGGTNWNGAYVDSGSTILSRTFSAIEDKRILLSNSQFARPFSMPGWTKLRVAMRLNMRNTGADLPAGFLYVGICSGSSNRVMDSTTNNWVGVKSNLATPWTFFGGSPIEYYGPAFRATKRVGSTTTDNATAVTNGIKFAMLADSSLEKRCFFFVDISKDTPGPGTYTINVPLYFSSDFGSATDPSAADFVTQSEAASPAFTNHIAGTARTLAADESAGTFDHVNIGWDQVAPIIEISDLRVWQLS